jgi:apolipoprotein D and lipocalin family protein
VKANRPPYPIILASAAAAAVAAAALGAWLGHRSQPVGNPAVPEPARPVDLERYLGLWYELGRYDNRFERNCEAVTAEYRPRADGGVEVINTCRIDNPDGAVKTARGRAKVVQGSQGTKLKVSFFGPFFADYWVLDHAEDYSWSIVGEPSGRYLWLLSRTPDPTAAVVAALQNRAGELGYDKTLIRLTRH